MVEQNGWRYSLGHDYYHIVTSISNKYFFYSIFIILICLLEDWNLPPLIHLKKILPHFHQKMQWSLVSSLCYFLAYLKSIQNVCRNTRCKSGSQLNIIFFHFSSCQDLKDCGHQTYFITNDDDDSNQ